MSINRNFGLTAAGSLVLGFLLMNASDSRLDASESRPESERLLVDFTANGTDFGWYVVNDNVMGGRSDGGFDLDEETLRFAGRTNTDGGGFSSIRTRPLSLDLSSHAGIRLRVRGDGRRYTWRLTTNARWRGRQVAYWADFETKIDTWSTVDVPFSSFIPRFRGVRLDGPVLDAGEITGMGLMIYDNRDGPFELRLASVKAYRGGAPHALTQYQWKKRVLVISAPFDDDENLRQQRTSITVTGEEFADRDMVLVTLLGDGVSTAGSRDLTADEAAAARVAAELPLSSFALKLIGKDGSIKLSSKTVVPMSDIYALIDTMPMRQRKRAERE